MKFTSLILLLLVFLSCDSTNTVTITGTVTNPVDYSLILNLPCSQDTITIMSDGSFRVSFSLDNPSRVTIQGGKGWIGLYLIPGSELNINFDGKELNKYNCEKVNITGNDVEASQFLLDSRKELNANRPSINRYELSAKEFDKIQTQYIEELNQSIDKFEATNPDLKEFIDMERMEVRLIQWQNYDFYSRRINTKQQDTIPLLTKFKSYANTIPLDNYEMFTKLGNYKFFVTSQYERKFNSILNAEGLHYGTPEFTSKKIDLIKKLDVPQIVKDELGYKMIEVFPGYNNDIFAINEPDSSSLEIIKTRYSEIINNEKYIKEFEKYLSKN
ncbi:hypothetical protein [Carboxylicivirga marina]|uniref:hypothetical protein n=1 Tax=Carboxylicivirga marina TaxID=2800988 RepID=UPI00259AB656|nr:hypothetical protein [uncultured Carboxylicivirga sp.]